MRSAATFGMMACLWTTATVSAEDQGSKSTMFPEVVKYLDQRRGEFDRISEERKAQLQQLATYVKSRLQAREQARLTFICTHNSRRSHLSQIWAAVAARDYGIGGVVTYSGGTEATACNPRAVAAIERAGLRIEQADDDPNPRYTVRFAEEAEPLVCYSKVYSDPPNPQQDYCAVMTCSQADKSCPVVKGCALRVAIPYDDPKIADGTPEEASKYDERCAQICREMLFVFSQVEGVVRDE